MDFGLWRYQRMPYRLLKKKLSFKCRMGMHCLQIALKMIRLVTLGGVFESIVLALLPGDSLVTMWKKRTEMENVSTLGGLVHLFCVIRLQFVLNEVQCNVF